MRINYTDDEEFPGQFNIWQANCRRSLRGKNGQAALRRLEAALLAMPEQRLIRGKLVDGQQQVCALGQLARVEGTLPAPEPLSDDDWDDDDDSAEEFGTSVLKFPRLVRYGRWPERKAIRLQRPLHGGRVDADGNYTRGAVSQRAPMGAREHHPVITVRISSAGTCGSLTRQSAAQKKYSDLIVWD